MDGLETVIDVLPFLIPLILVWAVVQLVLGPLSGGAIVQVLSYLPWSLWMIAFGIMLLVSPIPLGYSK